LLELHLQIIIINNILWIRSLLIYELVEGGQLKEIWIREWACLHLLGQAQSLLLDQLVYSHLQLTVVHCLLVTLCILTILLKLLIIITLQA
jgi:hypothetical protein